MNATVAGMNASEEEVTAECRMSSPNKGRGGNSRLRRPSGVLVLAWLQILARSILTSGERNVLGIPYSVFGISD